MNRHEEHVRSVKDEAYENAKVIRDFCLEKKRLKKKALELALICIEFEEFKKQYKKFKDFYEDVGKKGNCNEFVLWMDRCMFYIEKNRFETLFQKSKEDKIITKIEEI